MLARISATNLPQIDRIGLFPLENSSLEFVYRNPTNVIHLFEYYGRIMIDSEVIEIQPGDITCIQSGTIYAIDSSSQGRHWCVHYFDEAPVESPATLELPKHTRLGTSSVLYREQFQLVSNLHNGSFLRSEVAPRSLEARFRLKSMILGLINHGETHARGKRGAHELDWDEIVDWIDQRIGEPISLGALAKLANISPASFSKKFRIVHGAPVQQFLAHRRINKAKSLLENTTLTIYETGAAVGIIDPQYYNKQFRKLTGMSPSQYREAFRQRMIMKDHSIATQDGEWQAQQDQQTQITPARRKSSSKKKPL